MKLAAHPLVVAVALGLLDAGALAVLDDTPSRPATHDSCAHAEGCTHGATETEATDDRAILDLMDSFRDAVG